MVKIVVLDGYTLNPGDISWQPLEAIGECIIYDRTFPSEIVSRANAAPILLTNKAPLNREILAQLTGVKYVGITATGINTVDVVAAREHGIVVTNVPAYSTSSVAQTAFALLLELTQHTGHLADLVRGGEWCRSPDSSFWDRSLVELDGLTLGVVGFGNIGRAVARIALAFGMKVVATGNTKPANLPDGVSWTDLDTLLQKSDVVSLHCPLTEKTRGLISADHLKMMKKTAFLINTSRGPLVDESALAEALNKGRLAGAGLDVLSVEPPPASNPLLTAKNCLVTPHIGWATRTARQRLLLAVVENIRAFLQGQPKNVVN